MLPGRSRRILVVEDQDDARESLRIVLELWGYEVEVAADGLRGVERALAWRPDAALVDIGLPLLDGHQVGGRVREALGEGVLLIALTAYGDPWNVEESARAGYDVHLVKPADPDTLRFLLAQSRDPLRQAAELVRSADTGGGARANAPAGPPDPGRPPELPLGLHR
jgi:CheY-like chemotaxis protein